MTHAVTEAPDAPPTGGRKPTRWRWVAVVAAVVAAALLGLLGGRMIFAPEQVPDEVQTLVDDYTAAWDAGDGDAVVALMTEDGAHYSNEAQEGKLAADDGPLGLAALVDGWEGLTFEPASELVATHDGPPYEVARVLNVRPETSSTEGQDVVEIYLIVRDADGSLKIQTHSTEVAGIG
jgi:ketosteroid isomerase-like protein